MSRSLVLNATYEPLSIVPTKRAVVLLLRGKAVMVEPADGVWRSERITVQLPSVIKLRAYVRVPYARRMALNRRSVFARDRSLCQYCSGEAENLDHVLPRSRGGSHAWENVVASCRRCNLRKGNRTPQEARMKLSVQPTAPRQHGWVLVSLGTVPDPSWHPYLSGVY